MNEEQLADTLEALTTLCIQQQGVIASLEAKIDALIGTLQQHELPALRDHLLHRSSIGHGLTSDESRVIYQERIAETLRGIDVLLRR